MEIYRKNNKFGKLVGLSPSGVRISLSALFFLNIKMQKMTLLSKSVPISDIPVILQKITNILFKTC